MMWPGTHRDPPTRLGQKLQWAEGSAGPKIRGPCAIFVGEDRARRVRVGDFPEARIGIRGLGKLTGSLRRLEAVHCVRSSSVLATVLLRLKSGLASFLGMMWLAIGRLRSCPGTILDLLSWRSPP
jgi:hypothetical protein